MRDWKLTAAVLSVAACFMGCALFGGISMLLLFGGVLSGAALLWLAFNFPEFCLVATLFVPQLKAYWPLRQIGHELDLTVAMLVGLAIGVCWRSMKHSARLDQSQPPRLSFVPKWPIILFAIFAVIVALSYIYSPAASYGGSKLVRFLGIGGLLFISPFFILRNDRDLRRFVVLFLGAGVVLAIQMIFHLDDRQAASPNDITRIGAGWLMGMLILLALYFHPFHRPSHNSAAAWILIPTYGAALVASAARGPIIALLAVLILNLVTSTKMFSKMALAFALLGVSAYFAYGVFSHVDPGKYHSKLTEILNLSEGKSASGSAVKRLDFYRQTLAAIPSHFFLGQGIGSWSTFYYGADKRAYPHDLFLEVTFEEGFVGVAALCSFLFAMGIVGVRLVRSTGLRYAVFPSLVLFCLIVSMFSGDLDDNRILWCWSGITLAACAITRSQAHAFFAVRQPLRRYRARTTVAAVPAAELTGRYPSST